MFEAVSVEQAINKGHKQVTYPCLIILACGILAGIVIPVNYNLNGWVILIIIVMAFALAWLYWALAITKWRIWAFENVRNVHQLKRRAIKEQLIYGDGTWYEKTEIRSAADKEKLLALALKFDKEDVFNDDLTIPDETIIYYSKSMNFLEMSGGLAAIGVGVYLLCFTDDRILALILIAAGIYGAIKNYREATNTEAQIILDDKGIITISTKFRPWDEIWDEEAITETSGKTTYNYLVYHYNDGSEKLLLNEYDITPRKLDSLMEIYRGRFNKKNNR